MTRTGCLLASLAHLLGGVLALGLFALTAGHCLVTVDTLAPADAIVVLGGDAGNYWRVRHAVDLYNAGRAPVVVFSGGELKDAGLECSSAQLSVEAAQKLGFPPAAAIVADGAQSTYDEAINLRRLTEQHRWRSLIVVTDAFHTRRASCTFRALLPGVIVYLSAAPNPVYDPARWWQTEDGLVAVFSESLKLCFYWLRYDIAPL